MANGQWLMDGVAGGFDFSALTIGHKPSTMLFPKSADTP
jgi:hypothetical protein